MAKINLNNVTSPQNVSVMNDNFQKIMVALDEQVLYRDNPEGEPNQMENDLDMNGKRIYNLPVPIADSEPLRRQDAALIVTEISGDVLEAAEAATAAAIAATLAAENATEAVEEIEGLANSAVTAANTALSVANATQTEVTNNVLPYVGKRTEEVVYPAAMDATGGINATAILQAAINAAATANKFLILPAGTFLSGPLTCPSGFRGMIGAGQGKTTIRFVRQAYTSGQVMLDASSNTARPEFRDFTLDMDDVVFKTAGAYGLVLNGTNYPKVDIRIVGRGQSAIYTNAMLAGDITGIIDCTGTAGNSFVCGFQGDGCARVQVKRLKTTGFPQYSGVFGSGCYKSAFVECDTEGTSGAFGYSIGGSSYCHIFGCTARNTSHEAFQITDSLYSSIIGNTCYWETGFGVDAGISIHGKTIDTRLNKVIGNTVINSYGSGLMCADKAQLNLFADNVLKDCAVRGYAAAPASINAVMSQYTSPPEGNGAQCTGNTFRNNKIATEAGPVLNGYGEANNGVGATLNNTNLIDNEWQGGGTITNRYVFFDPLTSQAWDLDYQTATVTLTPQNPSITAYTASMQYRRRGRAVEVLRLVGSITNAGTATGSLTATWTGAPAAITAGGALSGTEYGLSGKSIGGSVTASGVVLRLADGTTPIATNSAFVLSGFYRI